MFSLKDENKSTKLILAAVCGIFFLACLYSIFKYGNSTLLGDLESFNDDDVKYIRSAWNILDLHGTLTYKFPPHPTVFIMPGLPYVLSFFMMIFGKFSGITAFRVFQALLQTLSILLVFYIGRKFINSKVAAVAAVLNALYIPEIWVSNIIMTEAIFKFLLLCLVYFSIYAVDDKKLKYYVGGGIFYGLSALFRPTIALYPIVILIAWIKYKYSFKEILKYTLVVAVIFCLILSPWWVRNYSTFNKFIPFTKSTGNPMLEGTYLNNNDYDLDEKENIKFPEFSYSNDDELKNDEIEVEKAKYRIKNAVLKRPLVYTYWYTIGKTAYQWAYPFYFQGYFKIKFLPTVHHWLTLLFAAIGLKYYYSNKTRKIKSNMLLITMIYFNCIYLPFFCFGRYVYPVFPFAMIFASYSLVKLSERLSLGKRFKRYNSRRLST